MTTTVSPYDWNRALLRSLVAESPPCHKAVAALIGPIIECVSPDGTQMEKGIRRLASESGQRFDTVREAIDWLEGNGWLVFVRTIAHRGRSFRLAIPSDPASETLGPASSDHTSDPASATLQPSDHASDHTSDPASATNLLPTKAAAAGDDFLLLLDMARAEARSRRSQGYDVKNIDGLARHIMATDEDWLNAARRRLDHPDDCPTCGGSGFVETYAPGAGMVRSECEGPAG